MKKLDEIKNIKFPTLKRMFSTNFVNPKEDKSCKVHFEKSGLFKEGDEYVEGTYYTYTTREWPKKYISVFVGNELNEDDSPNVNVVAIKDNLNHAIRRNKYRINKYNEEKNKKKKCQK